ncbi:MAG: hypothetical protein R3D81_05395 [Thalassovita sp.]
MTDTPFPFAPQATDTILDWTRARIADGPDPKHGAQSFAALDPVLGGSITAGGIGPTRHFGCLPIRLCRRRGRLGIRPACLLWRPPRRGRR